MCGEMDFCGLALIVEYPLQLALFCTLDGVQEFGIELSFNLQYCLLKDQIMILLNSQFFFVFEFWCHDFWSIVISL